MHIKANTSKNEKMKKLISMSVICLFIAGGLNIKAQPNQDEYLGLPGDNLNLYAVMDMFRESKTLEEFERNLNDEKNKINNLDLNGDNFIDYLMVTDYVDGDDHTIVITAAISKNEKQDVAVFTVNRFNNGSVQIQLIGDEELYGKNYIIEPIYESSGETPNPGYKGNQQNVQVVQTNTYEIAAWPMMVYIYQPSYVVWRSGWYYGYYPSYWHPWNPFYYHYYSGYYSHWYPEYYKHYRHWNQPRYQHYNTFYYTSVRSHSTIVDTRIREGNYRTTYSHPEMRSKGEKKGMKANPVNNRRSDSHQVNTGRNKSSDQNRTDTRRSTGTVNEKPASGSQQQRRDDGQSRSSSTKTEKSVTTPPTTRKAESHERSSAESSGKSATNPAPAKKAETGRRQEKTTTTAKPQKSSTTRATKTESSSKKSTKETETTPATRRK
jgi:hypothetical protein